MIIWLIIPYSIDMFILLKNKSFFASICLSGVYLANAATEYLYYYTAYVSVLGNSTFCNFFG